MLTNAQLSAIHRLFRSRQNVYTSSLLREHGYRYKVAFGCSLPDIKELAATIIALLTTEGSPLFGLQPIEVAEALWADTDIRESMLVAPLLYPRGTMTLDVALRWAQSIPTPEVADVACMYAFQFGIGLSLIELWRDSEQSMLRYCSRSLQKRLS